MRGIVKIKITGFLIGFGSTTSDCQSVNLTNADRHVHPASGVSS